MNKIPFLISRCSRGGEDPSTTSGAVPVQCVRPRQARDATEPEGGGPAPVGWAFAKVPDGLPGGDSALYGSFSNAVVNTPFGRRLVSVTAPPSGVLLCSVMLPSRSHSLAFLLPFVL